MQGEVIPQSDSGSTTHVTLARVAESISAFKIRLARLVDGRDPESRAYHLDHGLSDERFAELVEKYPAAFCEVRRSEALRNSS